MRSFQWTPAEVRRSLPKITVSVSAVEYEGRLSYESPQLARVYVQALERYFTVTWMQVATSLNSETAIALIA